MSPIPTWQSGFDSMPTISRDVHTAMPMMQAEIDALRQRVQELEAGQTWRPIESAPKDGTEILAYSTSCDFGLMHWIDYGDDARLWVWSDQLFSDADPSPVQPTHWMPLPLPPVESDDIGWHQV